MQARYPISSEQFIDLEINRHFTKNIVSYVKGEKNLWLVKWQTREKIIGS